MKRTARALRSRWILLGVAILAVGMATANRSESPATGTQETTSLVPATEGGMRAYIDPETGTIGSMPPSGDLEGSAQSEPEPQFEQVFLPDGSVMVDLKGAGQEYFILELDANGNRVVRCVEDPNHVTLQAPAAPAREEM